MSLPYTYKSKIEIPESEAFTTDVVSQQIIEQVKKSNLVTDFEFDNQKAIFSFSSLFNIKYPVELTFSKQNIVHINFEAKLIKLIQLSIILIVFIAFFSSFGMSGFLWFSTIFTIIFFSINVLFIENGIQTLIKSTTFFRSLNAAHDEKLSKEQLKWMNDTNKCPACGENLLAYDQSCPECGLRLPRKAIAKPFDISKYENKRLSYTYKPKNEPKK